MSPAKDPNRKFWNPEIEELGREQVRQLQFAKLRRQLKYDYENSIFYKQRMDAAGVRPEDVRSWEDFTHVPFMTKDDQRQTQEESLARFGHPYGMITCAPVEKLVRIQATSGTTGMPTLYTLTAHDKQVVRECHFRKYWVTGMRPGDIVIHAFALSMFTGGVPAVDSFQEFGVCVIPVGAESGVARVLQFIDLCKPTILSCTPSFAEYIIAKSPEMLGKPASALGLRGVGVGGEPGGGIAAVRRRIMEGFGVDQVHDTIGGSHNFHGYTCSASAGSDVYQGMHLVSEDYCVLEILDPATGESLPMTDGAIGEMCYTYIDWEGTPLLRYRLGDMLQVFTSPCECGDTRPRFKIIGRADDMLIVKGVNIYPSTIKDVVCSFAGRTTGELRILLTEPGPSVPPPLKIQVEHCAGLEGPALETLAQDIMARFHQECRVRPSVELVAPGTFERAVHKSKLIVKLYEEK